MQETKHKFVADVIGEIHDAVAKQAIVDIGVVRNRFAWAERHLEAWNMTVVGLGNGKVRAGRLSGSVERFYEQAVTHGLKAWAAYADAYRQRFDSPIGDDGVLGDYWAQWGKALRGLLNGDLGRLDGGTLDRILVRGAESQGVNLDE